MRFMIRLLCLGLFLGIAICTPRLALSQPKTQAQKPDFEVSREALIEEGLGNLPAASFNFGDLPASSKGILHLRLHNKSGIAFPITKMETGCSCLKLVAASNEIPVDGFLDMRAELNVPERTNSQIQRLLVTLFFDGDTGIALRMQYAISRMVAFKGVGFVTKIDLGKEEDHVFRVPIIVTAPLRLDSIKIETSPSLGINASKFVTEGENQFAEFQVASSSMKGNRVGKITLSDSEFKLRAETDCVMEVESAIVFAPRVLRCKESKDSKGLSQYTTATIVRVSESLLRLKDGVEITPDFHWKLEDWNSQAQTQRLAKGIYRINLTLTYDSKAEKVLEQYPANLNCLVDSIRTSISSEVALKFSDSGTSR